MPNYQRPSHLYRYAERSNLLHALQQGKFFLLPAGTGANACLTLSFSQSFKPELYQEFDAADSCLVIHQCEQFGERLHAAVQRLLPNWAGIDGAVQYGSRSPLGALFSKPAELAHQAEWLFAWRPMQASKQALHPVQVSMGSLEKLAELRDKDTGNC
ncbi:MAG: hypothetical protein HYZ45_13360 [Burkholderiales bacterium]|nr:hypothetical protein [Burkholderiales bacterium]